MQRVHILILWLWLSIVVVMETCAQLSDVRWGHHTSHTTHSDARSTASYCHTVYCSYIAGHYIALLSLANQKHGLMSSDQSEACILSSKCTGLASVNIEASDPSSCLLSHDNNIYCQPQNMKIWIKQDTMHFLVEYSPAQLFPFLLFFNKTDLASISIHCKWGESNKIISACEPHGAYVRRVFKICSYFFYKLMICNTLCQALAQLLNEPCFCLSVHYIRRQGIPTHKIINRILNHTLTKQRTKGNSKAKTARNKSSTNDVEDRTKIINVWLLNRACLQNCFWTFCVDCQILKTVQMKYKVAYK